jgi:hypothetical protein
MSSLWRQFADPEVQFRLSISIGMVALQCLVAIWAATSRQHWFWRALAVWAAIMLMIPIRAWEPAWLFGLSSPLIIAGLSIWQRIGRQRTPTSTPTNEPAAIGSAAIGSAVARWRFSLRDLFALMLIISLWLAGILETLRAYQPANWNWLGWLVSSFSLAALSLTSYALVVSPRRWLDVALLSFALLEIGVMIWVNEMLELPPALGLFIVVCGMIAAIAGLLAYGISFPWRHWLALLVLVVFIPVCATAVGLAGPWMGHLDPLNVLTGTTTFKIIRLSLIFTELSAMLVLVMALASGARCVGFSRQRRIAYGAALTLIGGAAALWLGSIYVDVFRAGKRWPAAPHDVQSLQLYRVQRMAHDIRQVNAQLGNWQPLCIANLPPDPALATVRLKLAKLYQELLPLLESASTEDSDTSAKAKAGFRRGLWSSWDFNILSSQLVAEFESAVAKKKWDAATDYAVALLRLGDILARGGNKTEVDMGSQIRADGHRRLVQIRRDIPPDRLRSVISSLERSQQDRGDPELNQARQFDYEEIYSGWGVRYQRALDKHLRKRRDPNEEFMERNVASCDLQSLLAGRLLQTELAIRLFKTDHGRLPRDLGELVPDYLPSIPVDMYAQPLVLKSMGETFVIYSIGWDRFDDGGTFSNWWDYEAGHLRWQREKGTWITDERRDGEPRQYTGQPGIDFDLETLMRPFVDQAVP